MEITEGLFIHKPCIDFEDFIDKYYYTTDNNEIIYMINDLLDSFFMKLDFIIRDLKLDIYHFYYIDDGYIFTENEYSRMTQEIYTYSNIIQFEYDMCKKKEGFWKYVDFDLEYFWDYDNQYYFEEVPFEKVLDDRFIREVVEKGRQKRKVDD